MHELPDIQVNREVIHQVFCAVDLVQASVARATALRHIIAPGVHTSIIIIEPKPKWLDRRSLVVHVEADIPIAIVVQRMAIALVAAISVGAWVHCPALLTVLWLTGLLDTREACEEIFRGIPFQIPII